VSKKKPYFKWSSEVETRLLGLTAYFPINRSDSPSRAAMTWSQFSAYVALDNPEPRMILTGLEKEMCEANMHKIIPGNSKVLYVLPYETNEIIDVIIIYYNYDTNTIDSIHIPRYELNDKQFGFEHRWTDELLNIEPNMSFSKTTKLTRTNTDVNDIHSFGLNANIVWTSTSEVAEDPCVVSDEFCKRASFKMYGKYIVNIDKDNIPLNLYGDDDNYKIMPDIGEPIRDDGILIATRKITEDNYLCSFSKNDLKVVDPDFDKVIYTRHTNPIVKDIQVIYTPPKRNAKGWKHTFTQVERYHEAKSLQTQNLADAIAEIIEQYPNAHIGNTLYTESTNALYRTSPKLNVNWNRDKLPIWRVEITVEYTVTPTVNYKITNQHGGKVEIGEVRPKELMPVDANGVRADIIMDIRSIIHRMNMGAYHEGELAYMLQLFNKAIKDVMKDVNIAKAPEKKINEIYDILLDFIQHIDCGQAVAYPQVKDLKTKRQILNHIKKDALRLVISDKDDYVTSINNLLNSKYKGKSGFLYLPLWDQYTSTPIRCTNMYVMFLDKIGEIYLASSSVYINPLGVPISPSKVIKDMMPANYVATKTLSEVETQHYTSFLPKDFIPEMRERSANPERHKVMLDTIIHAKNPMDIDRVIPRDEYKFEGDIPGKAFRSILQTFGVDIVYKKGDDDE
jgi:hypothetical protein